jgi:hypothetical protein
MLGAVLTDCCWLRRCLLSVFDSFFTEFFSFTETTFLSESEYRGEIELVVLLTEPLHLTATTDAHMLHPLSPHLSQAVDLGLRQHDIMISVNFYLRMLAGLHMQLAAAAYV